MAKTRKRRPSGPAQAMPTVAPATPGGPNRLARKEEARRQREALRRKMARRRGYRMVGLVVAFLLVAGAVSAYIVLKPSAAEAAGCGPVKSIAPFNPLSEDRSHIGGQGSPVPTPPPLSSYRSTPPTSGPHDSTPEPAGVYSDPPSIYRAIHSLEHAAVIIWYPPGTTGTALTDVQTFYRQSANQDHIIVAPYNYPDQGAAGSLPAGTRMVLVAWHHMQLCKKVSLAAAKGFVNSFRILTGQGATAAYKGDAPEIGLPI